jgi:hypothetical protein
VLVDVRNAVKTFIIGVNRRKKMSRKTKNETGKSATSVKELVTVAFAEDLELAKEYKEMLAGHDIPAAIKRQPEMAQSGFSDIAILVPEDLLDEAHDLISQQAACDDFFDMAFGNSDYELDDQSDDPLYDDSDDEF